MRIAKLEKEIKELKTGKTLLSFSVIILLIALMFMGIKMLKADEKMRAEKEQWRKEYIDKKQAHNKMVQNNLKRIYFKKGVESERETWLSKEGLDSKPFKPETNLSVDIEIMALALTVYAEARGDAPEHREDIAWSIVERAIDKRSTAIYKDNIAGVVIASGQFTPMKAYKEVVTSFVWGENLNYVPVTARKKGTDNHKAWLEIKTLAEGIMIGERVRTTRANHFWSPKSTPSGVAPNWAKYLKPVGTAGHHILYVDWAIVDGKKVYFTKENPYNPKKHG